MEMGFFCTGGFTKRGCFVKVFYRKVILIVYEPYMLIDIIAVRNILYGTGEQTKCVIPFS